jgi:hypothetical protein
MPHIGEDHGEPGRGRSWVPGAKRTDAAQPKKPPA